MRILDEKGLTGILKHLLELVMLGGAVIIAFLPVLLQRYLGSLYLGTGEKYWFLLPFLYITGFLALIILYNIRRILKTLGRKNPFMEDNVKSLRHIAVSSLAIAVLYLLKILLFNSFLTIILAMVFVIAGLFAIVLAEVFHQALKVKEENDLTI
ncbi:MAG: DUF2975 domain-containing protein [Ruminiclostridium sp.]|nr:DUF2975 domain-containing protein [Ruminiclostridium sp.]